MLLALFIAILVTTPYVLSFNPHHVMISRSKVTPLHNNAHRSQKLPACSMQYFYLHRRSRVTAHQGSHTGTPEWAVPGRTFVFNRSKSILQNSAITTEQGEESNPATNAKNENVEKTIPKATKMTIFTILLSTTLNLLGFTLTSPLNPTLGQHFNLPTGASFGSLTSAYPAGMLIGQFTWPRLSDSLGRKKVLALSLMGSGVGLSLQAIAVYSDWSLGVFLATRIFTGIFSGSAPVSKAFLADIGDEHSNSMAKVSSSKGNSLVSKYLGWRDAASTLSYILGPALGGILYESIKCSNQKAVIVDSSIRWLNQRRQLGGGVLSKGINGRGAALASVIGVSALGSLLASLMVMAFVKEPFSAEGTSNGVNTHSTSNTPPSPLEEAAKKDLEIMSCPLGSTLWTGVATVCVISFLYHIADSTFFAFYPALLQNQLGFDPRSIGMAFTAFAVVSFLCSATSLSSRLIEKAGVVNACAAGLAAISAGLLGLSTSASSLVGQSFMKILTFGAAAVYFAGVPLYGPTIPTMLILCVPPYQRGTGKLTL